MNLCAKFRKVAEERWLENDNNLDAYTELYTLPYGHKDRKILNNINGLT